LEKPINFTIRKGTFSDNAALLELAAHSPMNGHVSFRTDRYPNFFSLLETRGIPILYVAEMEHKIIGALSASGMNVYVDGIPRLCYYIGDFKVHPDFRKTRVALGLAEVLGRRLQELGAERYFSAVIAGNIAPDRFLAGSSIWPKATNAGQFLVRQVLPKTLRSANADYDIRETEMNEQALNLLNAFMKQFQFGTPFDLKNAARLLEARVNGKLLAALTLVDVNALKQDVLTGLPFVLNVTRKILRFLFPKRWLPELNEPIRALYIRSFACEEGQEDALKALWAAARDTAAREKYHFVTIGLHEKNPWKRIFMNNAGVSLRSNLYVALPGTTFDSRALFWLDYSLV
jgi:hypothetical protein